MTIEVRDDDARNDRCVEWITLENGARIEYEVYATGAGQPTTVRAYRRDGSLAGDSSMGDEFDLRIVEVVEGIYGPDRQEFTSHIPVVCVVRRGAWWTR